MTDVEKIFQEIVENDLLEDRREYSASDLWYAYNLGPFEAEELYNLIQQKCKE